MRAKEELLDRETAGMISSKKTGYDEQEWLDRFTKKDHKKAEYQDPNMTFKPSINKKSEKIALQSKGSRDAFIDLTEDSKKR